MTDPTPLIKKERELRKQADELIVDGMIADTEKYRSILHEIMALEEDICGIIHRNGNGNKIPL